MQSFNDTRDKEAIARDKEAQARIEEARKYSDQRADEARKQQIEAAKPFLQLRQERYTEIVKTAAILSNPDGHDAASLKGAKNRFIDLYIAELSMVESRGVEGAMTNLMLAIDPQWKGFDKKQEAAYRLSHALRDSLIKSWGVPEQVVDNPK